MPRKDRRFTPADIARLYCGRLSERDKLVALGLMSSCGDEDLTDNELIANIIRAVADLVDIFRFPGSTLISTSLRFLAEAVALERTEEEISDYLSSGDGFGGS